MRIRILVLAVLLLGALGVVLSPSVHAAPSLLGWTSRSDANPFSLVIDNAAGLGGFHPVAAANLPEDSSDFETGPFAYGLATLFWPGSALGNAGSLAGQAGLPSQLAPLVSHLNDPVRAQTLYPGGPKDAAFPHGAPGGVAEMTSHADGNGAWAKAGLTDVSIPGVFEVKSVHGSTTATAGSVAQSTATGSVGSVSLLAGLVHIGATTSTASASSDGVDPKGTVTTHIGAVTIAGHPISFGKEGLVVGPVQTGLLGSLLVPPTSLVNDLIGLFNIKITPLPSTETHQAPAEEIKSGGLQVSFALPPQATLTVDCSFLPPQLAQLGVLCHLPDQLQGVNFSATIGRVTATAIATPPFTGTLPSIPPTSSASNLGTSSSGNSLPTTGSATNLGSTPPRLSGSQPSFAPVSTGSTSPTSSAVSPSPGALTPIALSSPVKAGLLGSLLVLALIVGAGLRSMARVVEQPAPTICPLEEDE